jgi:hypothetical protein
MEEHRPKKLLDQVRAYPELGEGTPRDEILHLIARLLDTSVDGRADPRWLAEVCDQWDARAQASDQRRLPKPEHQGYPGHLHSRIISTLLSIVIGQAGTVAIAWEAPACRSRTV